MEPTNSTPKIDPKLRMFAGGGQTVNTLRAEISDSVVVSSDLATATPEMRGLEDRTASSGEADLAFDLEAVGEVLSPPEEVYVSVFIQLADNAGNFEQRLKQIAGDVPYSQRQNLVYSAVPLTSLSQIASEPAVISIEKSESIVFSPPLDVSPTDTEPPANWQRAPGLAAAGNGGAGVIIGIIDVQGFDFSHPDFLDAQGSTRFLAIWDQGGTSHPSPEQFGYGSEITRDQMNAALKFAAKGGLPATLLEPQSQMVPGSHGTHVTSIAAGNRGVCPQADIAAVLIALPKEDQDRRRSFYDSSRITHAVDYLFQLGHMQNKPVSINISLGTNGHAHDGSSVSSRWIDYALTNPGRCVTVAAGNAGQEKPSEPGDWGFVLGRIHNCGTVPQGSTVDIEWVVVGDTMADLSENELQIWYSPQDHFGIQIRPPDGDWTDILQPGEFYENCPLANKTFLSIYNELYSPANGANTISCYLSPYLNPDTTVGVKAGTWLVRLHGLDIRDGSYHLWIERDDPRRMGKLGMLQAWSFPSFLSENSNVDNSSVSSLACGQNIISVANLDEANACIHITSSQGPTRDGRHKPDLAAPGTNILAACGFSSTRWVRMTGTSMAAPFVTGVAGQLLSANPTLTAPQICAILGRTANPLPSKSFGWLDDCGFGVIDPAGCLRELQFYEERKERKL